MNRLCLIVAIALSMALSACAHHAVRESRVQMSYVSFQTLDEAQPRAEAGVLRLPVGIDHRVPAVVIVHGSAGVDSRGSLYAADLNDAGIATLEIDMWAARGIRGPEGRPKGVPETLPGDVARLVSLTVYPDAAHGWDRLEPAIVVNDPYSHLGRGGEVRIAPNEAVAVASRAATVSFFRCKLGLSRCPP